MASGTGQGRLRFRDGRINTFQCFVKTGGIAADLHCNAFDTICHSFHLPRKKMNIL